jgi:Kdo2-lipid IVA lauroyltransferase/acyltransferase
MEGSRARPGLATAPATLAGVRQLIRALRRGEAVGLLPDQVPPEGMGVWAPFFGKPAYTMTLAARLVQQTGAVPLLVWGERLARGAGYAVHFLPFEESLPADASAQAESAAVINRAMERLILQRPQQYLWGYNRYKQPRALAAGEGQDV